MSKHTFVICAYKESKYLEKCVKSIVSQSLKSDVIIATSTNNSFIRGVSESYSIPMIVADHESDIARDWNFAIKQAKTDYVTIAHQDDVYTTTYAEEVVGAIEKIPDAIICFTDYFEIRDGKKVRKNNNLIIKRILLFPLLMRKLAGFKLIKRMPIAFGNSICCPSVTYIKSKISEDPFTEGMKSNIDWEEWEKLSKQKGKFIYIPKMLMGHRIHQSSTTTQIIGDSSRGEEDYYMFRKFWPKSIAKLLSGVYKKSEKSNDL